MIDWARLSELRSEIGEDDFQEIVEMFLEDMEEGLARLGQADGAALCVDLHYLKGCALNLGFKSVAVACDEKERLAKSGKPVDTVEICTAFSQDRQIFLETISKDW